MKYQNCAAVAQAPDEPLDVDAGLRLSDANINPSTGLATDYLNRFNEAVMLLDMLATCPEFRDDFLSWEPMSYRDHFRASHSRTRDLAIAAYETADPNVRSGLDTLAATMTVVLEATRAAMTSDLKPETIAALAGNARFDGITGEYFAGRKPIRSSTDSYRADRSRRPFSASSTAASSTVVEGVLSWIVP